MQVTDSTFINNEELYEILDHPDKVIMDCRFDLSNPAWGFQDYLKSHLPKAIYADLDKDLSGTKTEQTGRHPLPEKDNFINTCSNWGIDESKHVIVYDTTSGSFAARLWWLLKYYGHSKVSILDGSFTDWIQAGYPIVSGNYLNLPEKFSGEPDESLVVRTNEMETIIRSEGYTIIDARSPERYLGLQEPIDPIAGHIPNAINFFHQNNLDSQGKLLPINELGHKYDQLLHNQIDSKKIVYCGSGVTSCLNIAVMKHLGIKNTRLYLGSWSEWIRDTDHPIINETT
jgi:thiosulfate/3-mercaptopyruvate sulfurtransferase